MSKFSFFLITLFIGLFYVLHFDKVLADHFTAVNNLKKEYIFQADALTSTVSSFFDQASKIKELTLQNQELFKFKNLHTSSTHELSNIYANMQTLNTQVQSLSIVKVLSYVNFNDFTKVWLDIEKQNDNIYGLVDGEYSAGIVVQKSNKAQALLNGHEKSNYSVYIGEDKAPGIIHKNKNKNLLSIKYIPIWININIGDEVITSGMDNIFFEGLKVGKVVKINKMQDQQEAFIKPYSKVLQKKYFYIYKKEPDKTLIKKEEAPQGKKKP